MCILTCTLQAVPCQAWLSRADASFLLCTSVSTLLVILTGSVHAVGKKAMVLAELSEGWTHSIYRVPSQTALAATSCSVSQAQKTLQARQPITVFVFSGRESSQGWESKLCCMSRS